MNTLHLQYAVEVERCGSITQAAENLFMAQPNLSKAIRDMEEGLGIAIFERTPRGMAPTPQGREFLAYAKGILAQVKAIEAIAGRGEGENNAFSASIPRASYIADAVSRFFASLEGNASLDAKVEETNPIKTINDVSDGKFALGVIRYASKDESYFLEYLKEKRLLSQLLWEFSYCLLLPSRHPLAARSEIYREDLKPFLEIAHGDLAVPYLPAPDPRKNACWRRVLVFERSIQFDLLGRVDDAYMWVSPVPDGVIKRHGLIQRRCADATERYRDALVMAVGREKTPLEERFLKILETVRDEASARTIQ